MSNDLDRIRSLERKVEELALAIEALREELAAAIRELLVKRDEGTKA